MMGFGKWYLADFARRHSEANGVPFIKRQQMLLQDRYGASHILKPIYESDSSCFFTVCDDPVLQQAWAREHGLRSDNLTKILLAQIEEHGTEVLYNSDPISFPSSFVKQLPGCVKKTIAWRTAPCGTADLSAYDTILSNFESLSANWRLKGWKTTWFSPSWDPEMASYAANSDRRTDIFFAGSYSRTTGHDDRLEFLNSVAGIGKCYQIDLRLLYRNWGRLADRAPWRWVPIPIRLPDKLAAIVGPPVYGRAMYSSLSHAKIVVNPATDIAGDERGNIRCWEAPGCGACMLASAGRYPEGFAPGVNFETFTDTQDLLQKIEGLLADEPRRAAIAKAGSDMIAQVWSKERQWQGFEIIAAAL